jgi:serine/threonine protein kinase/formylglycine-generating enzyme required for sulfatase activity
MSDGGRPTATDGAGAGTRPFGDVSELVALCLERISTDGEGVLDELCASHPEHADELRMRIRRLQELGLAGGARQGEHRIIGPFRVLGVLGQGGMGRVYLGQQSTPVRRLAAVKVMHPGVDAERLLRRFEAERQALAVLSHPGIAQVLEAGTTLNDEPWFAMEYVDGQPLTTASDEARLGLSERIELFLQVCDAITHAHQNGILHRDLKPGNVLVTERPGRRLVKVIDFGLAKVLDESQQLATLTQEGQVVGTPTYMSPEQAGVIDRFIDLRADVYALGVLLYELLTGVLPLKPKSGGAIEMLKLLRDVEPTPPSRRVAGLPADLAARRRLDPRRWSRALADDLDWIVGKALSKDPELRYASVSEMAGDLRRHLAHEPVLAGPPSAIYRIDRFVRRHRREVGVGAAGLVALIVALVYISFQAARLSRELDSFDVLAREMEVAELQRRADQDLWPELPERVSDMRAWRADVEGVVAQVPAFEQLLESVRERGRIHPETGWRFQSPRDDYLHAHIVDLLASIEAFGSPGGRLEEVAAREAWALGLQALTIDGHRETWQAAIASIADPEQCTAYDGLVIEPQLGLVPLARNPDSGLWEFAFPRPNERLPEWIDGRWRMEGDTCMVFVLIPGGSFVQGGEGLSTQEADGKPVSLAPFFLSKYEMTQGQWLRFTGENPARYGPRSRMVTGLMHPVEQVSWLACNEVATRLGLQLPTGAQWEYAARAGRLTLWWPGDTTQPPECTANLADIRIFEGMGTSAGVSRFHMDYDDRWPVHAPVDALRANPFGLHHVIGNLWEWCLDQGYRHSQTIPRPGDGLGLPFQPDPKIRSRQARGGSYMSTYALSRSTFFYQQPEDNAPVSFGLRPARPLVSSIDMPEVR